MSTEKLLFAVLLYLTLEKGLLSLVHMEDPVLTDLD